VIGGALLLALALAADGQSLLAVRVGGSPALAAEVRQELDPMLTYRALPAPYMGGSKEHAVLWSILTTCGSDDRCLRERLAAERIALACLVEIDTAAALATIALLDAQRGLLGASSVPLSDLRPATVRQQLRADLARILDQSGIAELARLVIRTEPVAAQVVWLEGDRVLTPDPLEPKTFHGPPGRYRYQVSAEDFEPVTREVLLVGGVTTLEQVQLVSEPSAPWLWIGAGVLALAAGSVAVVVVATRGSCPCVEISGACPPCP
jgi:hypothetical protein